MARRPPPRAGMAAAAVLAALCAADVAGAQQPADAAPPPVSIDRIRKQLEKPPPPRLDRPLERPVATFRSRVEQQKPFVPTLDEWLRQEFKVTALQRQSAEWASMCCGVNLVQLYKSVGRGIKEHQARKLREQIQRDLAELDAKRKKK